MNKLLFLLSLFSVGLSGFSQSTDQELIQFSGIVVTVDSLAPVPFATILVKNTNRGTTSDYYGYFSFVAKSNDTIVFSSIGFKDSDFIVPDSLNANRFSLIHSMQSDTVKLETVNIFPWPTPEQFKKAFLELDIPDDDLEIARKNLDLELLAKKAEMMPMDGSMNFKWQNQQRLNQVYFAGQYRPNNLLNPIAWAKFIEAWKRGDFKRKDD